MATTKGAGNAKAGLASAILHSYRAVYHFFGFSKSYNFPFYFITVGTLTGFALARLSYLNVASNYAPSAIPGEWYWFRAGHRRVGITIHLIGVLFGSLLAAHQFTPALRHRFPFIHRIVGHIAILLYLLGNAGAFMNLDHSAGGGPSMYVLFGILGVTTTVSISLAYLNIKRLQIDQHRAWMIRTWSWGASIISLRLIMLAAQAVCRRWSVEILTPIRCDEIFFMFAYVGVPDADNPTPSLFPACDPDAMTSSMQVLVSSLGSGPHNAAAQIRPLFGMATLLAIAIHVFLTELYLRLTPAESYRLRVVSRERQLARGWVQEGDEKEGGLGASRIGDAPLWWSKDVVGAERVTAAKPTRNAQQTSTISFGFR